MARSERAPTALGAPGRRLWQRVTERYELTPAEMLILEESARTADEVARLERLLRSADLVVRGSRGQPVAHPLLDEIRRHRGLLKSLTAALKLPAEPVAPTLRGLPGGSRGGRPQAG
jgi:hypothetical protein